MLDKIYISKLMSELEQLDQRYSVFYSHISGVLKEHANLPNLTRDVLTLLADICFFVLNPKDNKQPYNSFLSTDNYHALNDFSSKDKKLLVEVKKYITNNLLKARVYDIIWLWECKNNYPFISQALSSYVLFLSNATTWNIEIIRVAQRALQLAYSCCKKQKKEACSLISCLKSKILKLNYKDTDILCQLADFWLKLKPSQDEKDFIFQQITRLSTDACIHKAWYLHQDLLDTLISNEFDSNKKNDYYLEKAKCYEFIATENRGFLKASCLKLALKNYSLVPKRYRAEKRLSETLIDEIHIKMNQAFQEALFSISPTKHSFIIEETAGVIDKEISNKDLPNALISFAFLIPLPSEYLLCQEAKSFLTNNPLLTSLGRTYINPYGEIYSITPGIMPNETEKIKTVVFDTMYISYMLQMSYAAESFLKPAFDVLLKEHQNEITNTLMENICLFSTVIPKNRIKTWEYGLLSGFLGNFTFALNILSPQLEHLVRTALKKKGFITSGWNMSSQDCVESERGLSVLLRTKNITDVFSPEFVFNCKAIFAEKPGPNLRNELAHGLLDDDCINSSIHLYAWWFIFRLVVEANERVQEIIKKRKMQINNSLWK